MFSTNSSVNHHSSAKQRQQLFAIIFLVIIALGSIAAIVLNGQNQDSRQQASQFSSTDVAILSQPDQSTFFSVNNSHTISLIAHIPNQQPIHGIQLSALVTGSFTSVPTLLPQEIPGLSAVASSVTTQEGGYRIDIAFVPVSPSAPYTPSSKQTTFATLTFTPSAKGAIGIVPSSVKTKIIDAATSTNLLISTPPLTFTACAEDCPTTPSTPLPSPTATPTTSIPSSTVDWDGETSRLQADTFSMTIDAKKYTSSTAAPKISTYHNYTTGLSTIEYSWTEQENAVTLALDVKKTFEQDKWVVEQMKARIGDQYAPWNYFGGLNAVSLGAPIVQEILERTAENNSANSISFSKLVIQQPNFSEIIPVVPSSPAPTPPTYEVPTNTIHWKTEHAELKADGLLIAIGGKIFYSTPDQLQITSLANVPNHMTFSINWREHGVPMGIMFEMIKVDNGTRWYVSELEIRDGSAQGPYLKFDRWSYQTFPEPYKTVTFTSRSNDPERRIYLSINNLSLLGFLHEVPTASPITTLSADINKDGKVNLIDYSILSMHFLKDGTYEQGDINTDGKVNLVDYSIWSSQLPR